jgi:hypothetical protein
MAAKKTTAKKRRKGWTAPKMVLIGIKINKRAPIAFEDWRKLLVWAIDSVEDVYPERCQVPIFNEGKRIGEITVT